MRLQSFRLLLVPMKQMDEYGRTHSVYYSKKVAEVAPAKAAPKAKKLKSLGKREVAVKEALAF